ncbi:hypothetical protein FRB99_002661 [Tulasnella sp. 403]|nr:hypothetical protein FRB99_002661 [Tulasnella sp. 403]
MPYQDVPVLGTVIVRIQEGDLPANVHDIDLPWLIRQLLLRCWERKQGNRPSATDCLTTLNSTSITCRPAERSLHRLYGLAFSGLVAGGISLWEIPEMVEVYERDLVNKQLTSLAVLDRLRIARAALVFGDGDTQIGIGGFGSVHRARMGGGFDTRIVAVKKLQTFGDKRRCVRIAIALVRELTVWRKLHHENITRLIGFFLSPDLNDAWLVSPYYKNGNVKEYLARGNPSLFVRMALVIDVAEGLSFLHTRDPPVCHGDIKPCNVLINRASRALLCDFGLTRSMDGTPTGMTTSTFHQCGSLVYQSPELLLDTPPYKDTPALGALIKSILGRVLPFTLMSVIYPTMLQNMLKKCWSYKPADRPNMMCNLEVLRDCKFEQVWAMGLDGCVEDLCLSRDGALLAVGFWDRIDLYDALLAAATSVGVCVWDIPSKYSLVTVDYSPSWVIDMSFTQDNQTLAVGCAMDQGQVTLVTLDMSTVRTSEKGSQKGKDGLRELAVGPKASECAAIRISAPHNLTIASYSTPDEALRVTELGSRASITLARNLGANKVRFGPMLDYGKGMVAFWRRWEGTVSLWTYDMG